jgi:glyoxylase-like metal-dependent hydrolase (beta-lactamase superfamily II)
MSHVPDNLGIRQLYDPGSHTCSYLIWDRASREAAMIDPVLDHSRRDINLVYEHGLRLKYTLETHVHTDHVTGSHALREAFNSIVIVHENSSARCADVLVKDGDFIPLGVHRVHFLYTPGHSNGDVCLLIPGAVFTGDTLLVRSCGRTDYQSGDAGRLYDSITRCLFTLPDETIVYPGHDYDGQCSTSIGAEKRYNPRLGGGRSREDFIAIMSSLKLDQPAQLYEAFPSNLRCGTQPAIH